MLTLKQLQMHTRPIVFLDTRKFYAPLRVFLDHMIAERFAKPESAALYHFAESPRAALDYLDKYSPASAGVKWL